MNFRPGDLISLKRKGTDVRSAWYVVPFSNLDVNVAIFPEDVVLILAIAHEGEDLIIWLLDRACNVCTDDKTVWPGIDDQRRKFLLQGIEVISP